MTATPAGNRKRVVRRSFGVIFQWSFSDLNLPKATEATRRVLSCSEEQKATLIEKPYEIGDLKSAQDIRAVLPYDTANQDTVSGAKKWSLASRDLQIQI